MTVPSNFIVNLNSETNKRSGKAGATFSDSVCYSMRENPKEKKMT